MRKIINCMLITCLLFNSATISVFAGSSTPPSYQDRVNKYEESQKDNEREEIDTTNDRTERPVVDNSKYEKPTTSNRPKRPVVTPPEDMPIVDISGEDNNGEKPERPIVDTTTDDNDDTETNISQKPTRPSVDIGSIKESVTNNEESNIESDTFLDISENHSNYQAILTLAKKNIISGDGTGYFRPSDYITRAEFVKIICTAFDLKLKTNTKTFDDVKSHWAKDFVYIAASNGLISGVSENRFAPNENITYQQIAKIIVALKGWENNAMKLGGYPDGYVNVVINNHLFENSKVETSSFKSTSYYAKNSTRADVAQIVYNAISSSNVDKTIIDEPTDNKVISQPETVIKTTPYIVTNDLGETVTGTNNPSLQQIYNYVYNRIKERDVYKKDPNVLNAIMAMIWTENKGIHYENGHISYSSNSSSTDYGICQLNDSVFPDAKYWGWRENLNAGIDKYASAYWMCMGEEAKNRVYAQSVEKSLQNKKAQTYQEARARSAYCMYNHNNDARERWFTKNDTRDSNFYKDYVNKDWAKTLTKTGNSVPVTKPQNTQSGINTNSTSSAIKYDGKTYTYIKGLKSYKIATKAYSTDDYANIQDVWKLFYGYNPTFYDNNPLYGRLEWYCPGVGSLFVEYDMRNKADGNTYQFDIYRFSQDGNEFLLPVEYVGYDKILSNTLTMTKHGNIALIGIKKLANVFACDIDYKNQIKLSSTLESNLQKITNNRSQETEASTFIIEKENIPVVFSQTDNRWSSHKYGNTIGTSGCGLLSITNAVYYLNGQFINPKFSAEFSKSKGLIGSGGSSASLYEKFSDSYGDKYGYKYVGETTKIESVKEHLARGGVTIVGTFSGKSSLHIMAVVDYRKAIDGTDEFLVLDSAKSANRFNSSYAWVKLEQPNNPIYKKVGNTTYTYHSRCFYNNKEICFGNFRMFETAQNSQLKILSSDISSGGWFEPTKDFSVWWNTDSNSYYRYSVATLQYVGLTGVNKIDSFDSLETYEADRLYKNCGIYNKYDKIFLNKNIGITFPANTFKSGNAYKIWVGEYDGKDINSKILKSGYIYIFAQ